MKRERVYWVSEKTQSVGQEAYFWGHSQSDERVGSYLEELKAIALYKETRNALNLLNLPNKNALKLKHPEPYKWLFLFPPSGTLGTPHEIKSPLERVGPLVHVPYEKKEEANKGPNICNMQYTSTIYRGRFCEKPLPQLLTAAPFCCP